MIQTGGFRFKAALHKHIKTGQGSSGGRRRDLPPTELTLRVVCRHEVSTVVTMVTKGLGGVAGPMRCRAVLGLNAGHVYRDAERGREKRERDLMTIILPFG